MSAARKRPTRRGRDRSRSGPGAATTPERGPYGGRELTGPRQSWGWHPLTPSWADRIVADARIRSGETVLDLGAGTGALTTALLAHGADVLAVELHPERAAGLRRRFADAPVRVVQADLERLRLPTGGFAVVASPPYNLGVWVVRMLLGHPRLRTADLVLPRHLVRRLVTSPPRARHTERYLLTGGADVPPYAFTPAPRVRSQVLRIRRR